VQTALAESVFHRSREIGEGGVYETRMQLRVYLADLSSKFHDVRSIRGGAAFHDPDDYERPQQLGRTLLEAGSNGIVYRSVRHPGGECVACFRPRLVRHVRIGGHYEYRWEGRPEPVVRKL
jgi:hypothetical protein